MANPSLQIGNNNWAIKEDNLLGYSTAGTRFVPQPITMTRATAGTRVNPSGLVEDVELLGSELVTNGDFESGTSGWSAYYSGTLNNTGNALNVVDAGAGGARASTSITTVIGKTYKFVSDVLQVQSTNTVIAVSNAVNLDGAFINSTITTPTNGVTVYFTATATTTFIGFKRGGGGVGVTNIYDNVSVKEATIDNLARVDYTDGTSSLLVEPQRTNLVTYSEDFSNWSALGTITVTTNDTTSPSGGLTADKVLGLDSASAINQIVNGTSGIEYTNSCYIKNLDATSSSLLIRNGITAVSSLLNWSGSVLSSITNNTGTTTFTDEGNGWYRLISTYTSLEATQRPRIYPAIGTANTSVYIWGAQLEEGSYGTSYIPTSGSTVTRNQETYTKTGISDKINSTEGVLFVEMAALSESGNYRELGLSDGTTSNRVLISYKSTDNVIRGSFQGSGGANLEYTVTSSKDFHKIAVKWKVNDFAIDGLMGLRLAPTWSGIFLMLLLLLTTLDNLSFDLDGDGASTSPFYGNVRQLQIFKTALSDFGINNINNIIKRNESKYI